jgi:hypothetical protein
MGFIPQSEGIADVGQHKNGQRQYRNLHHLHSDRKSTSPSTELAPTSDYLVVVMTKVQLLPMHGIFRLKPAGWQSGRPSGLSSANLLVYWHNVYRQSKLSHGSNSIATSPLCSIPISKASYRRCKSAGFIPMPTSRIRTQLPAKNIAPSRLDVICFAKGHLHGLPACSVR